MSAKKFVTMMGIGIAIVALDYYLITVWKQIFGVNPCLSQAAPFDVSEVAVCWGMTPSIFLVVNVVAIGATIGYIYQVYRTLRYGW